MPVKLPHRTNLFYTGKSNRFSRRYYCNGLMEQERERGITIVSLPLRRMADIASMSLTRQDISTLPPKCSARCAFWLAALLYLTITQGLNHKVKPFGVRPINITFPHLFLKMDRTGASYTDLIESIRTRLGHPLAMQIPLGDELI